MARVGHLGHMIPRSAPVPGSTEVPQPRALQGTLASGPTAGHLWDPWTLQEGVPATRKGQSIDKTQKMLHGPLGRGPESPNLL
jgi:hypothetical protein